MGGLPGHDTRDHGLRACRSAGSGAGRSDGRWLARHREDHHIPALGEAFHDVCGDEVLFGLRCDDE